MTVSGPKVYRALVAATALMLIALPVVTTVDDLLNSIGANFGLDAAVQFVARPEAHAVVGILGLMGVRAMVAGPQILIWDGHGHAQYLLISATCIGWQSLLLLALSLVVGLRGPYSFEARSQVVLLGVLGTVLVNVVRMSAVALVAAWGGFVPAVIFHDYGGTALIVLWLFAFWFAANRWILAGGFEVESA
ncbi:MAG: exosortase/archaeosortase family protein [Chloroflexi bacterium]|nr:MAG: exosortase/archaeosortase family protein [Chloroflexota bacterium]